jgi:hypothetical protein
MRPLFRRVHSVALVLSISTLACNFDSEQAERVQVPVVVDGTAMGDFTNNEGYAIHITTMRVAFDNVEFTSGGEMHASLLRRLSDLVVPTAYAHPGHYGGGEIVGEMNERFVVDWLQDGKSLGHATMLEAAYNGANFVFTRAMPGDGITADDPLVGHTIELAGEASKDGQTWAFHGLLDQEDGKRVVGLPMELDLHEGDEVEIGVQLLMLDPYEPDTALDNLDFASIDDDGDFAIEFEAGDPAYNLLVKQLQVHDQYDVTLR